MTFLTAVRLIASACGSTGWVASVIGVHPWQLALFPDQAQEDVWGEDPGTRMSSSYAPTGKVERRRRRVPAQRPVELLLRLRPRDAGCCSAGSSAARTAQPADFRTFLLPIGDYAIDDVWDTVGLRGTGSNDIVVEDAFVPAYRSLSFNDTARCVCPGQEVNPAPLYRIPYGSLFPYAITTPIIGMAHGRLRGARGVHRGSGCAPPTSG